MKVAIIPARGGSKRIPQKNIKLFYGKPIIAYSIDAAKKSGLFDQVIVSTDDQDIAEIARQHGADVPFLRPPGIADDHATLSDVIQHAILWFAEQGQNIDVVCCILATAPFLRSQDLKDAASALTADVSYVFSATECAYPVFRAFKMNDAQRAQMLWPENYTKRSQDLDKVYHDAGMFYFGKAQAFLNNVPIIGEFASPFLLPHYRVQDIDVPDDWYRAEKYFQALESSPCGL